MSDVIHVKAIAEELQRICDVELKSALDLKSVLLGDISFLPSAGVEALVNAIVIAPTPSTTIEPSELPKQLFQKYFFRIVYLRRMAVGENPITRSMVDVATIVNKFYDKIQLEDITNIPDTAMILWSTVRSVEWNPPEDTFVSRVSAEITAVAFNLEVAVRTRRS